MSDSTKNYSLFFVCIFMDFICPFFVLISEPVENVFVRIVATQWKLATRTRPVQLKVYFFIFTLFKIAKSFPCCDFSWVQVQIFDIYYRCSESIFSCAIAAFNRRRPLTSSTSSDFARRLRQLRLAKGFAKARHFAEAVGISENRYTRYERGDSEPDFALVTSFCQTLGVTPNDLFGIRAEDAQPNSIASAPGFAESSSAAAYASRPVAERAHSTEDAVAAALGSAAGAISAVRSTRTSDAIGWRLAEQIALICLLRAGGEHADPPDALTSLRETGRIFVELQNDPYGRVARFLAGPALAAAEADVQEQIGRDIKHYLQSVACDL